jgi:hypothetical protein
MMLIAVYSPKGTHDAKFLSNYAYINLTDPIARSYGVALTQVYGIGQYAMRLWVKPDRLAKMGCHRQLGGQCSAITEYSQSGRSGWRRLHRRFSPLLRTELRHLRLRLQRLLPSHPKRSALVHARAICVVAKQPLALGEIERRIRAEGYVTHARDFGGYLRRVLRSSGQFVELSPGMWGLSAQV